MKEEIFNAQIKRTALGREDHGIFTAYVEFAFGGSVQGNSPYFLNNESCWRMLDGIITASGADRWEDLVGRVVRIKREDGMVVAIGHVLQDRWFRFSDAVDRKDNDS